MLQLSAVLVELRIVNRRLYLSNELLGACARSIPCLRKLLHCGLIYVVDLTTSADDGTAGALLGVHERLGLSLRLCLGGLEGQPFDLVHYCSEVLVSIGRYYLSTDMLECVLRKRCCQHR